MDQNWCRHIATLNGKKLLAKIGDEGAKPIVICPFECLVISVSTSTLLSSLFFILWRGRIQPTKKPIK